MARTRLNFWIDDELREALLVLKAQDGLSESEEIRRAIKDWLEKHGVTVRHPPIAPEHEGRVHTTTE